MRILMLHNRYLQAGGEDVSTEAEVATLRESGHHVTFIERSNETVAELGKMAVFAKSVWSSEMHARVRETVRQDRVDVVHVQNFFPLISPSVYYAAKAEGAAVVQALRNYRLLCPAADFHRAGKVCEDCLGRSLAWPGIAHACYRDSRAASAAVALMAASHRACGTWRHKVDRYIAPSAFARAKFVEGGFPAAKIAVKPNFLARDPGVGRGEGGYALYVGRLSAEKGLNTLLAAWRRHRPAVGLRIIGDGPLAETVKATAATVPNVRWLGRLPLGQVYEAMGAARIVIVPSTCYETFGRTVVEAFATGTPALVARIGALAELVEPGRTGLHFAVGDCDDLAAKLAWFADNPDAATRMRASCRREYESSYTAAANVRLLTNLYAEALAARRTSLPAAMPGVGPA